MRYIKVLLFLSVITCCCIGIFFFSGRRRFAPDIMLQNDITETVKENINDLTVLSSKYPDMEIVAIEYDNDVIENAYNLTLGILDEYPDLDGIICCNMSNPVGAARAITERGSHTVIVGMDHDKEALEYLKEGVIYCLGVQDCYSIGFDTIQVAVKIADGNLPGDLYPEKTDEITTIIYQEDAAGMLELLYGEVL